MITPQKINIMVRYEEINSEWRKEIATFTDHYSVIYQRRGEDMFGAIQSFYTPTSKPFYFKTTPSGFREGITKDKLNELITQIK